MLFKKKGVPEVGEIVLCTVKKILYHSVFVSIDEYENKDGMIHISEIAPGRIRNLRDYVKEDKRIVCKVLDINRETRNIDLSLRRVPSTEMVQKLTNYKQEEKAEKLLVTLGKRFNKDLKQMYELVGARAIEKHGSLYAFFNDVSVRGKKAVEGLELAKEVNDALCALAAEKIKPVEIKLSGTIVLKTFAEDGIVKIKKILADFENEGLSLHYLGAPNYKVEIVSQDYKTAETKLRKILDKALETGKNLGVGVEFVKHAS
ncbi:MAG TPA: S1 RNA-binding domain-containing protein [Candidatus Nanoarchaeia archaeon]|nr:S1 RNA-binding domain-containing protein [Candidatus Nanoarchaeia archaeon]